MPMVRNTQAASAQGRTARAHSASIDLMSISSHKMYGPMGVGALYVGRSPRVRIKAMIDGGGQERGMRSGTLPTPLIVGFGAAAEIASNEMAADMERIKKYSDYFIDSLVSIPHVYLNGDREARYPGNINLSFSCIEGESMIGAIKNIAVSSGSACTSASLEPSYVLRALGLDEDLAHTSIRFGIGRFTTQEEIDYAIGSLKKAIARLRDLSPLWDMLQEGIDLKSVNWSGH